MIIIDLLSENPAHDFAPCLEMTHAISSVMTTKGRCTKHDLAAHNFAPDEIDRLLPAATFFAHFDQLE